MCPVHAIVEIAQKSSCLPAYILLLAGCLVPYKEAIEWIDLEEGELNMWEARLE